MKFSVMKSPEQRKWMDVMKNMHLSEQNSLKQREKHLFFRKDIGFKKKISGMLSKRHFSYLGGKSVGTSCTGSVTF